ncbi:MAG: diacylglycerol kinase family protein [Clostridia bacterium]|nr:diacylglycerol kinase family protein [Clostridia bacterium]
MTYILYNPLSEGENAAEEAEMLSILYYDDDVHIVDIRTIGAYTKFFSGLNSYDKVIVCGGDGTLNHFINDTDGIDIRCNILYHAIGKGNDFMRDIGETAGANPVSVNKYLRGLPYVYVNGKKYRFINSVSLGVDARCCETCGKLKRRANKPVIRKSVAAKEILFRVRPTSAVVTVDGKQYTYEKVWIAPTMKGRFYGGGMMPTPSQDRTDPEGKVSLMVLHGSGKLKTLAVFPSIFKGKHIKHTEMVAIHTGHNIHVTFDRPTSLQIDGETFLGVTEYSVKAGIPAAISHSYEKDDVI